MQRYNATVEGGSGRTRYFVSLGYTGQAGMFNTEKEQNYISNAKMMLMQRNHLSEDDAYRYIQKSSMDSGTNMVETAQMLLMLLYES